MSLGQPLEARRRYRVLDLIGRGGSGCVYRARMEGADGFTKEVALKVVRKSDITSGEIARFRDEARILGLVRDRAIVSVDPPIHLGDRWAIVMEYVEGVSAHRLVGRVPPRAAIEIVGEVARVLHKIYAQPGPDGEPLHLLHRDLKPGNLQITPDGDVKLLDFGVASAKFESRETVTMHTIAGTLGYIAPERLRGIEGPEGDVYSLGILLHVLVTGDRAVDVETRPEIPRPPEVEQVVALAQRMRDPVPTQRPSAREVQRECGRLAAEVGGPTLREWAVESVPAAVPYEPDELVGSTLTETVELTRTQLGEAPTAIEVAPPPSWRRWVAPIALLAGVALGLPLILVVAIGLGGSPRSTTAEPPPPELVAIPIPVAVAPPDPEPVVVPVPEPVVVPVTRPRPAPAVTVTTVPDPAPTPAPPREPVAMSVLTFDSEPAGATISLDGVVIGRTPLRGQPVSHGVYQLRLERDGQSIVRTIRVGRRGNTSFSWQGEQLVAQ